MKTVPLKKATDKILGVSSTVETLNLLDRIAQDAAAGRVDVWSDTGWSSALWRASGAGVRVPQSEWVNKIIDPIAFLSDGTANCILLVSPSRKICYADLELEKRAVRYLRRVWRYRRWRMVWTSRLNTAIAVITRFKAAAGIKPKWIREVEKKKDAA